MHGTACFLERITTSLPIATFFLSAAVAVVAVLQWRVARNKLRLDLFDRRYKVFEATREFLLLNASFEDAELGRFKLATADAEFLFGSDVVDWLAEIRKLAAHLSTTRTLLSRPKDDELAKRADAEKEDLSRLIDRADALTKVFAPYLGFAKIK